MVSILIIIFLWEQWSSTNGKTRADKFYLMESERKAMRSWKMKQTISGRCSIIIYVQRTVKWFLYRVPETEVGRQSLLSESSRGNKCTTYELSYWDRHRRREMFAKEHFLGNPLGLLAGPMWPSLWTARSGGVLYYLEKGICCCFQLKSSKAWVTA